MSESNKNTNKVDEDAEFVGRYLTKLKGQIDREMDTPPPYPQPVKVWVKSPFYTVEQQILEELKEIKALLYGLSDHRSYGGEK